MGVIQRQGFKHSIVNFAGLAIAGVSTLWLYPLVIGEYGLFQLILSVGVIGLPLFSMGANTVAIRFFPFFKDPSSGHHGFLGFLLGLCAAGFSLSGVLLVMFWDRLLGALAPEKAEALDRYLPVAAPIAMLWVMSTILSVYSVNFKRIVVPSILLDFSQKIAAPLLLWMVYRCWITLDQALWGLLAHASLVFLGMLVYLRSLGQLHLRPDWSFWTPGVRREIARFIVFGAFGGFALLLITKADLFMVGSLLPIDNAGIYSIAIFLAAAIEIPTKSLYSASVSTVAMHIAHDDRAALLSLYRKVSINLLCVGLLLFGAIWISIDEVYALMEKTAVVAQGKWVFFFIGMAKLVEMATGLNNYMIYYSPHYRLSLLPLGVLAAGNIIFGIYLIPHYGLAGAAMATLAAVSIYNAFSLWIVWKKFGIQPFDTHTLAAIAMAVFVYMLTWVIPAVSQWPLANILLRSGLYFVLLLGLFLGLRVSTDLSDMVRQLVLQNPLFRRAKK